MKKFIVILLGMLIGVGSLTAHAAEPSAYIKNTALQETIERNSLWLGSSSMAGLAFFDYSSFNTLDFGYDGGYGEYRANGVGKNSTEISLNTKGAAYIGKTLAIGSFSFKNAFDKDALYNVLLYELEDNMPYYPIDDKSSDWNRQEYNLNAGLSSPVIWDCLALGIKFDYSAKVGAKQLDPRGETYKYSVSVQPSVALRLGVNILGLSAFYANGFERSTVSVNNVWVDPKVWEHRGLGESTQNKVGGNDGMKDHTYRTYRYGGSLQYSLSDFFFVEAGLSHREVSGLENPKLPKKLGTIKENDISLKADWLFGNNKSDKLAVNFEYTFTDGIEYVQKLNTAAYQQEWMVISTNKMSTFTELSAGLAYDHMFGADDPRGYTWKVGGESNFHIFDQSYLAPASTSNAMRLYGGLFADRQLKMNKCSLIVGLDAGYASGLGSGYKCLGTKVYNAPKSMLEDQADWLNASYLKAGGRIDLTMGESNKVAWVLGVKCVYMDAFAINKSRLMCMASFGILF